MNNIIDSHLIPINRSEISDNYDELLHDLHTCTVHAHKIPISCFPWQVKFSLESYKCTFVNFRDSFLFRKRKFLLVNFSCGKQKKLKVQI